MQSVSATTPSHNTEGAAKIRLTTLGDLDQRTKAARLARQVADDITSDLGGADSLSAAERQLAQRAAMLSVLVESQEAHWLQGEPVNVTDWLASVNCLRRVLESVGLQRRNRDVTPSLTQYLQRRASTSEASAA